MKQPTKRSVNFNAASPSWQTDFNLNDLPNLTPSFPEQDGDLVFG